MRDPDGCGWFVADRAVRMAQMDPRAAGEAARERVKHLLGLARNRVARLIFERDLVARTDAYVPLDDELAAPGRHGHHASSWLQLRTALRGATITADDVLVDFGSGMGRIVYVAARHYPFARVVGVEISQRFNDVALANLEHARPRLRCQDVQIVTVDATEFVVPDDMTYAYMFNPFGGEIFEAVLGNIVASLDRRPRRLTLCYAHPLMEEAVLATGRFERVRSSPPRKPGLTPYHGRIDVFASTG
jgi:hypothetical protein